MNLDLSGKNALVCGSSKGIGLAIAKELAELGANCILVARNEISLQNAIATLPKSESQNHRISIADFMQPESVKNAVNQLVNEIDIHILINNTGGPPPGKIAEASLKEFQAALAQHLYCNHMLALAVLPGMKASRYGRIINIISTSVKIPLPNLGVSNTTRAAVAAWAKTLANEIGPEGITVNSILPGFTTTERLDQIIENKMQKEGKSRQVVEAEMAQEVPLRRFGKPEEVAALAAFLASPAAAYISGTNIPVDGGRTGSF